MSSPLGGSDNDDYIFRLSQTSANEQDSAMHPAPADTRSNELQRPPGIEDFGQAPKFGVLVHMLDTIERRKRNPKFSKALVLKAFFDQWRSNVGPDLHPVVRLLLPDRDTHRRTYALRESNLAKALSKALELPRDNESAKKLKDWKVPSDEHASAGEFSTVAYDVIKERSTVITEFGDMDIHEINKALDDLSRVGFRGKTKAGVSVNEEHARILRVCLGRLTALEMKWLIRIILRDLKCGVGERVVFQNLHPDALDLFNRCSDIQNVCWTLHDPNYRLPHEDKQIRIEQPFGPMLCYRNTRDLDNIVKLMKANRPATMNAPRTEVDRNNPWFCTNDEFLIEEKLDGERIQLHKHGNVFRYWSRKTKDYTSHYGDSRRTGSLTPFLFDCFIDEVEDVVLDGEMLVWMPTVRKYMPFGQLKSYSKQEDFASTDARPCFKVFDILYIKTPKGAKCFLDVPLYKRKLFLSQVLKPKQGVIELAESQKGTSTAHLSEFLKRILEDRGEGLVVKHPLSLYMLSSRDTVWIKVKPDYMDQLGETIDGRVIGGYWGQGNRGGFHGSFLIGVTKEGLVTDDGEPVYLSLSKVGTGFNASDYKWMKENIADKYFDYDRHRPPAWFRTISEWPDQLIHPSESFVVKIKAAEIVTGRDYATGVTLRFPRAHSIDFDGDGLEDSLEDINSKQRNATNKRAISNDLSGKNKRTKAIRTAKRGYISKPVGEYEISSKVFDGMTFYVHNLKPVSGGDDRFVSKDDLQKLILENGGDFIQRVPDPEMDRAVIASNMQGIANKKGAKNGECDILLPDWVLESVSHGRRMPLHCRYFVFATNETQRLPEYDEGSEVDGDENQEGDDWAFEEDDESKSDEEHDFLQNDSGDEGAVKDTNGFVVGGTIDPRDPRAKKEREQELRDRIAESDSGGEDRSEDEADTDDEVWQAEPMRAESKPLKVEPKMDAMALTDAGPGLGAGHGEMHHDPGSPFGALLLYFDVSDNATANDLREAPGDFSDDSLLHARRALVDAGGKYTDRLDDPQLTHIVVSPEAAGRYGELLERTRKPRYRRIVTPDWVTDSIAEGGLVDEDDYKP